MIIMINGAWGVDKTTIARKLVDKIPNSMIYDPEEVGFMLRNIITDSIKTEKELTDNFQDLDMWRKLVVHVAGELILKYKKNLIVPMIIKRKEYFNYIYNGFESIDSQVYHYCLTSSLDETFEDVFFKYHVSTENKSVDEVVEIILNKTSQVTDKYYLTEFLGGRAYTIKADNLDLSVMNSANQRIRQIIRKKPYCEVIVDTNPLIIQQQLDIGDLNKYLKSTKYIESDSIEVNSLIKDIIKGEKRKNIIIKKILEFTRNIKIADELPKNMNNKDHLKQSVAETIRKGMGNCCDCTNVFIAVMRNIGVPCKFILGKSSEETYHYWGEVFIEEQGWIPVETKNHMNDDIENWYFGITNRYVKIFEGLDYEDINIKTNDMDIEIKLID